MVSRAARGSRASRSAATSDWYWLTAFSEACVFGGVRRHVTALAKAPERPAAVWRFC